VLVRDIFMLVSPVYFMRQNKVSELRLLEGERVKDN